MKITRARSRVIRVDLDRGPPGRYTRVEPQDQNADKRVPNRHDDRRHHVHPAGKRGHAEEHHQRKVA